MGKLRLAFMGSPDLGLPCLNSLDEAEDMDVLRVVTLGDRRRGRRGTEWAFSRAAPPNTYSPRLAG